MAAVVTVDGRSHACVRVQKRFSGGNQQVGIIPRALSALFELLHRQGTEDSVRAAPALCWTHRSGPPTGWLIHEPRVRS